MKLNIFIVSVACFSCLLPSACGSLLVAKAVAAAGAVKGAALLGAGALAVKGAAALAVKGAVVGLAAKGAAVVAAKHAALKTVGAAVLAAKALAIKKAAAKGAAVLLAKKALLGGAVAFGAKAMGAGAALASRLAKPEIVRYVPYETVPIDVRRGFYYRVPEVPRAFPTLLADRVSALVSTATTSLAKKAGAASNLLSALNEASVYKTPVLLDQFEVVEQPSFYPVPVIETDC